MAKSKEPNGKKAADQTQTRFGGVGTSGAGGVENVSFVATVRGGDAHAKFFALLERFDPATRAQLLAFVEIRRRRGRPKGSGMIDDTNRVARALELLASGKVKSNHAAARLVASEDPGHSESATYHRIRERLREQCQAGRRGITENTAICIEPKVERSGEGVQARAVSWGRFSFADHVAAALSGWDNMEVAALASIEQGAQDAQLEREATEVALSQLFEKLHVLFPTGIDQPLALSDESQLAEALASLAASLARTVGGGKGLQQLSATLFRTNAFEEMGSADGVSDFANLMEQAGGFKSATEAIHAEQQRLEEMLSSLPAIAQIYREGTWFDFQLHQGSQIPPALLLDPLADALNCLDLVM